VARDQPLTREQRRVAAILLATLGDLGFCLAGGAALIATGLSNRPTRDIDAFTDHDLDLRSAADRAVSALAAAGFEVVVERADESFVTLLVTTPGRRRSQFRIDLGRDHIAWPPVNTALGRTLSPRELAANKVLALFGRVQPRDLVDVARLVERIPLATMLADAASKDSGLDPIVLAEMVQLVMARPEPEWPPDTDVDQMREFGRSLVAELGGADSASP